METIQNGRNDPWYMLDNADTCISALDAELVTRLPSVDLHPADQATTVRLDYQATVKIDTVAPPRAPTPPNRPQAEAQPPDPQLLELFIEEAKEEMASVSTTFPLWEQNPMDLDSLVKMRRSFHTLKGSGRMVGARLIGEFAWSIENLLNRVLDKTLSRTPGMMSVMRSAVGALPHLIEQLETGRPSSMPVEDIMTRAYAFAEGREAEQAFLSLAPEDRDRSTVAPLIASLASPVVAPAAAPTAPAPVASAAPAAVKPAVVTPAATPTAMVPPATGVAATTIALSSAVPKPPGPSIATPVIPAAPAGAPAAPAPPPATSIPTATATPKPPAMDPVLHEIYSKETANHLMEIRDYLKRRVGQPGPHDLPENIYRAIHTLSGSSKMAEARHGIRVTEPLNHYMRKVFDSGQGLTDAGLRLLADAVAAIENVVSHIDESTVFFAEQPKLLERMRLLEAELDGILARAPDASGSSALVPALAAQPPIEAFDHEIANIFSEEATELLEGAQASLNAWKGDRNNKAPVAELQRQLHTLKGGARMAGITAMGNLSHELETLVIQIDSGVVPGGDTAYSMLQTSLDELARMRDIVGGGSLPAPAISRMRANSSRLV